jgi:aspartate--ammonia ligase
MKEITEIYKPLLDKATTEDAIELIKSTFTAELSKELKLKKVSAPMIVLQGTGINDDLNGTERAVKFPILDMKDQIGEIVHSLAKWKRLRLKDYNVPVGQGILTDMRALRPDETFTPLHSIFVDQWDWERTILPEQRNLETLKETVKKIYKAIKAVEKVVHEAYPQITPTLPEEITFIHAEDLLAKYPNLPVKKREAEVAKQFGAVFIIGIGGPLKNGEPHDGRAPDYDDWTTETAPGYKGMNGDIVVWNTALQQEFELSSMGIRVSKEVLEKQLKHSNCENRKDLYFHKQLLSGNLFESCGGGIGQSRLCMFLLKKKHIGEVQVSIWPDEMRNAYKEKGIDLF